MSYRASAIKSIQHGTVVIGAASNSDVAAISSVNTASSYVMTLGGACSSASFGEAVGAVVLTSATVVTGSRLVHTAGSALTIGFIVVEYYPWAIKSMQPFTVAIASGVATGTTAITAVTTAKTMLASGGFTNDYTGGNATIAQRSSSPRLTLTSNVLITGTGSGDLINLVLYGTAVEFR